MHHARAEMLPYVLVPLPHSHHDPVYPRLSPLQAQHVACSLRLVEGKGHTAFLLEDPMKGGRDLLVEAVLQAVTGQEVHSVGRKLCPAFLCNAAAAICPF